MDDEDLAVGRLLDVELDVVRPLVGGEPERRERVLRGRGRRPAVRDDGHLLDPADRHRNEEDEAGDRDGGNGDRRGEEARVPDERAARRRDGLARRDRAVRLARGEVEAAEDEGEERGVHDARHQGEEAREDREDRDERQGPGHRAAEVRRQGPTRGRGQLREGREDEGRDRSPARDGREDHASVPVGPSTALGERAPRGYLLEEDEREREGPADDGPEEKRQEGRREGGDEEGRHPELRRAAGEVVVDVVVPEEREVDEAATEAEREEARENAHDHVRREGEDARRVREGEKQRLPRAEPFPVRPGEADGHQAGHLETRDRGEDDRPDDDRDDPGHGRQEGLRDLGVGDDVVRVAGEEEPQEEDRPGREKREREGLPCDVGRDEPPPRSDGSPAGRREGPREPSSTWVEPP